jgi:hypothetical protein
MSQAVITPISKVRPDQGWGNRSVQAYFAAIDWQGATPAERASATPTLAAIDTPVATPETVATIASSGQHSHSLDLKVGEFFAQLNWQRRSAAEALPAPSIPTDAADTPVVTLKSESAASSRPPAEALLDIDLLENVFQPEGEDKSDISIGDFSDFF